VLVFDGGCPFCRHFAELSELRSGIAGLTIADGRADGPLRQRLAARGYHLRNGAMVLVGDRVLHGAEAVTWLCAQMQLSPGLLQLLAAVLADPARSRATYPLLLAARRLALGLKRLVPADADPRALTIPNVERVLDELRPYLMADGGNVEIVEIDGPIVKVRLQGACGSCPSSTMTLKMGIERKLREAIPEVAEVIQVL